MFVSGFPQPVELSVAGQAVAESKTIIWNGPMGVFEMAKFEPGIWQPMDGRLDVQLG